MLVVIAGLSPAIEMQVELLYPQLFQLLYPLRPVGEGDQLVVFIRIIPVILGGALGNMGLAGDMHHTAADEL